MKILFVPCLLPKEDKNKTETFLKLKLLFQTSPVNFLKNLTSIFKEKQREKLDTNGANF